MKYTSILFVFIALVLSTCNPDSRTPAIDLETEWQRMNAQKESSRDWFNSAKFGMFIHWGIYSIPAGVWEGKTMEEMGRPRVAEWIQYVARIPREEYARLSKEFNPVLFNADSIAQLARDAGMKYLVITTKHHDGFAMYDSKYSQFDIMDATPYRKDVVEALYNACKKYGIEFGMYYSHNIDWADGGDCQYSVIKELNDKKGVETNIFGPNLWDPSPNSFEYYLKNKAYPQVEELLKKFPDTRLLWYDMSRYMLPEQSFEFYRLATSIDSGILINERVGNGFGDYVIPGDNKIPACPDSITKPWETVGTLNNSWGFKSYDHDWKSPEELIFWLVEIVSKGGNYMLNIGPKSSGEVPEESIANLRSIGKWLSLNGEAIYNTRRWVVSHEGPTKVEMDGTSAREELGFIQNFTPEDIWFTSRENYIYAIGLEVPSNREVIIKSLDTRNVPEISGVRILGTNAAPRWERKEEGLNVMLPVELPSSLGYVIAVELK